MMLSLLGILPVSVWGQASAAKTPDNTQKTDSYAAESVVYEHLDDVYTYAADGTGTKQVSAVMRIQSEAAVRNYGVLTIPFAANNEHVELDYVRVRKPDGSVVETPVADAMEMPSAVSRQAPFYSDLKEKQLPIRNLRVGDKLEYQARSVRTRSEAPGEFWGQRTFGDGGTVVLDESVELHVPKGKYIKVWSPDHAPTVSEENGQTVYRWKGSQLEPTVKPDGKANTKETDPDGDLPDVAWTTFKTWQEVGAWYQSLEADRVTPDTDVKAKAAELIAGKTTDEEKVRALYSYVATQIRYIGVAFGIGRYQPHPAGEVLHNQYGDCKDKHTLLAAMLTSAGFHPEAVLIGAGIRFNEDVPSPGAFNHLITTLPVDGKQVWLDTTSEVAPYRMLLYLIRDKQALVIPDSGAARLERTPADPPFPSSDIFLAKGTLSKEGTMNAHIEMTERGDGEVMARAAFRQVSPGQWEQFVQLMSKALGFGGTTSHVEVTRPEDTDSPLKLNYDYLREKTGDWDNFKITSLFPALITVPSVDEKDPPRKQPIDLGPQGTATATSIITLPDGWGADLPAAVHEKTPWVTFDKTYRIEGNTLTTERRIEVLQRFVPASEWKTYKKWYDATVDKGEPFIQLTSPDSKPGTKAPPAAGSNNEEAAKLVQEAYQEIQRGEVYKAKETLDQAAAINSKQVSLWSTYGFMHYQKREWDEAADAYKKELALYPNTEWVYGALCDTQVYTGKLDEAMDTLRAALKVNPSDNASALRLASLLMDKQQYSEVITILKSQLDNSKDDSTLQLQLGIAQMKDGQTKEGSARIAAALKDSDAPNLLNSGAWELAEAGVELDAAEKGARKAVDLLTQESTKWNSDNTQIGKQGLLIAAWDTLGWILFKEDKVDEAEGYIRAAWLNQPSAEVGLHLGEIEEKKGNLSAALSTYRIPLKATSALSLASMGNNLPNQIRSKMLTAIAKQDAATGKLHERVQALEAKGIKAPDTDEQKMRTFALGKFSGKDTDIEYDFAVSGGKMDVLNRSKPTDAALPDTDSIAKRAEMAKWTPPGSTARLIRKGFLNCYSNTCEFVVAPVPPVQWMF
ncbi:MAG: DUF3857 domain-containing protein [Acidobacteriaceae bacterium]|nr:DUF3857 domain-containing protein [Acidobacteriaceae bacterium]